MFFLKLAMTVLYALNTFQRHCQKNSRPRKRAAAGRLFQIFRNYLLVNVMAEPQLVVVDAVVYVKLEPSGLPVKREEMSTNSVFPFVVSLW